MSAQPNLQPEESNLPPEAPQLEWPDHELSLIVRRVKEDWESARMAHQERMTKFERWQKRWRRRYAMAGGTRGKSNFAIPLVQSQLFIKWAKVVEQMLGEDAEVVAVPVGPSDQKNVVKIGRYITWLLFNAMDISNELILYVFNYLLYGRSIAYAPYKIETFEGADGESIVDYTGPGFCVIEPDDYMTAPEEVKTLHDFSWMGHRYYESINDLLDGEENGRYFGISDNLQEILDHARGKAKSASGDSPVKDAQAESQGVSTDWAQSYSEQVEIWCWNGWWRPLVGEEEADPSALKGRDARAREYVVCIIPGLDKCIRLQGLAALYPKMRRRRPYVEIATIKDGTYWPPSVPELVESMEDELTANHNLATEAIERSIGPIILFRPGTGFDPETFVYEPGVAIPMDDPTAVNVVRLQADIQGALEREHTTTRWVERVTGMSDLQAGRASDRPNAPRTARQTLAILEESNIRVFLDTTVLRNDLKGVIKHIWEVDTMYGDPEVFFRVTEEQAKGLFDVEAGGAKLTQAERAGKYDFTLQFASSVHSKEARKQNQLALYQLDLGNPLVVQNPRALYHITSQIHKAFGDDTFADVVPEPPESPIPHTPKQEMTMLLQGDDIHVHPEDNDDLHLKEHYLDVAAQMNEPPERKDSEAIIKMLVHIQEQEAQKKNKQMAAAQMQAIMQMMGPQMNQLQLPAAGMGGMQGMSPGMPMGDMSQGASETSDLPGLGGLGPSGQPEAPMNGAQYT